jgi:hypothetical protein
MVFLVNKKGDGPTTGHPPATPQVAAADWRTALDVHTASFQLSESALQKIERRGGSYRHGAAGTDSGKADRLAVALGEWPMNDGKTRKDRGGDADHYAGE